MLRLLDVPSVLGSRRYRIPGTVVFDVVVYPDLPDGTGLVSITEPHNPSGVRSPRARVEALAELTASM